MVPRKLAPNTTSRTVPRLAAKREEPSLRAFLDGALQRWKQNEAGEDDPGDEKTPLLANKIVELTAWRSEQHLRSLCFFTPERGKVLTPLEYVSQDGKTKIHVSPNVSYGLPNVWDADILDFIISKGREQVSSEKEFPSIIVFTASECLKALGKHSRSGKNHQLVRESLQRLSSAWIRYTAMGNYEREQGDTLLGYRSINRGKFQFFQVKLHSWFLKSIRSGNILATDPAIAEMLKSEERSGLKKLLIRIISVRMGRQNAIVFWQDSLMRLCQAKETDYEFRRKVKELDLPWEIEFRKENGRWKVYVLAKTA